MIALHGDPDGECRLEVLPRVYRKICTNGLVQFSEHGAAREIPPQLLWCADLRRPLVEAIVQAIRGCLDPDVFEAAVQGLRRTASEHLRMVDAIALVRNVALPREAMRAVLRRFRHARDLTRWGLINAVTAEARTVPSTLQLALERSGGTLAGPPPRRQIPPMHAHGMPAPVKRPARVAGSLRR
jgi:hypothetical protein